MGFLDALLGRTKPAQPDLDRLFGLPGARITLEASEGLVPGAKAGVCFKPASGQDFAAVEREFGELLSLGEASGTALTREEDEFGYRWVIVESADFDDLVTRVHMVNSTLQDHGWGPQLLCSVVVFHAAQPGTGAPDPAYLVYLYKRGSFYPFVPIGGERRDNEAELRLKNELESDLTIEKDLDRWFPIWKLPID